MIWVSRSWRGLRFLIWSWGCPWTLCWENQAKQPLPSTIQSRIVRKIMCTTNVLQKNILKTTLDNGIFVLPVPKVQFKEGSYKVDESEGEVRAMLYRSGDISLTSTVRCYTRQGSAQVMMDYMERPNTDASLVTFLPGETLFSSSSASHYLWSLHTCSVFSPFSRPQVSPRSCVWWGWWTTPSTKRTRSFVWCWEIPRASLLMEPRLGSRRKCWSLSQITKTVCTVKEGNAWAESKFIQSILICIKEKKNPRNCICFFLSSPSEAIIQFSEIKYSVREPIVKGNLATVKIPILRFGDTSKVSVVRVHTKDGSATSGEDYNPLSEGKGTQSELVSRFAECSPRCLCLRCGVQEGRQGTFCGNRDPVWWTERDERGLHCPHEARWQHGGRNTGGFKNQVVRPSTKLLESSLCRVQLCRFTHMNTRLVMSCQPVLK